MSCFFLLLCKKRNKRKQNMFRRNKIVSTDVFLFNKKLSWKFPRTLGAFSILFNRRRTPRIYFFIKRISGKPLWNLEKMRTKLLIMSDKSSLKSMLNGNICSLKKWTQLNFPDRLNPTHLEASLTKWFSTMETLYVHWLCVGARLF